MANFIEGYEDGICPTDYVGYVWVPGDGRVEENSEYFYFIFWSNYDVIYSQCEILCLA